MSSIAPVPTLPVKSGTYVATAENNGVWAGAEVGTGSYTSEAAASQAASRASAGDKPATIVVQNGAAFSVFALEGAKIEQKLYHVLGESEVSKVAHPYEVGMYGESEIKFESDAVRSVIDGTVLIRNPDAA